MSGLTPVYEKIKENSESKIEMEDVFHAAEHKEASTPASGSETSSCKESKCCKSDKRSFGRRLCACACGFIMFGLMLWIISGVAVATYFGAKAYRCMHPRHQQLTSFTFADEEAKEFDLGVVTGTINIHTCSQAQQITLVVARRGSSAEMIEVMPIEKSLTDGVFKLNVLAPSFDWQHCQSAAVELIIPDRLADKVHLTVKAQTILGRVMVNAPKHTFNKLSILSNLGVAKVENVKAQETVEAEARVGYVRAANVEAKGAALRTTVGSVCADRVEAADELDVEVQTGRASLGFLKSATGKITSELGWVSAWGWRQLKTLDARVDFGRLNFAAEPMWTGKFTVESPYGWIEATHHRDAKDPVLEKNTPAIVSGSYKVAADAKPESLSTLTLKGIYGAVNFFIPSPLLDDSHRGH